MTQFRWILTPLVLCCFATQVLCEEFGVIQLSSFDELTIVSTIDGALHGIRAEQLLWSTSTGAPLTGAEYHDDGNSAHAMIPSTDGSLYLWEKNVGIQKTSIHTKNLVEKSPFVSSDSKLMFSGHKIDKMIALDVETGRIVGNLDTQTESQNSDNSSTNMIWFSRVDYMLRAVEKKSRRGQYDINYSEIRPLHVTTRQPNKAYTAPQPVYTTPDGDLYFSQSPGSALTLLSLGSPVVSVFRMHVECVFGGDYQCAEDDIVYSADQVALLKLRETRGSVAAGLDMPAALSQSGSGTAEDQQDAVMSELDMEQMRLDRAGEADVVAVRILESGRVYAMEIPTWDAMNAARQLRQRRVVQAVPPALATRTDPQQMSALGQSRALALPLVSSERLTLPCPVNSTTAADSNISDAIHGAENLPAQLLGLHSLLPVDYAQLFAPHVDRDALDRRKFWLADWDDVVTIPISAVTGDDDSEGEEGNQEDLDSEYHRYSDYGDDEDDIVVEDYLDEVSPAGAAVEGDGDVVTGWAMSLLRVFVSLATIATILYVSLWIKRHMSVSFVRKDLAAPLSSVSPSEDKSENSSVMSTQPAAACAVAVAVAGTDNTETVIGSSSLTVDQGKVLGLGSQGTIVFAGQLRGRPVAVKRILSQFCRSAEREVALLIRSDGHPNVVRYHSIETHGDFVYLALQLCAMTLKDFISRVRLQQSQSAQSQRSVVICDDTRAALYQVACGVAHLHSQRIVHRDLKPHNILCALHEHDQTDDEGGQRLQGPEVQTLSHLRHFVLKISDMGLSKQLQHHEHSFEGFSSLRPSTSLIADKRDAAGREQEQEQHQSVVGTVGWQAPELLHLQRGSKPHCSLDSPRHTLSADQPPHGNDEDEEVQDEEVELTAEGELSQETSASLSPSRSSDKASLGRISDSKTSASASAAVVSQSRGRRTKTVDIFSLGCVFHYVVTAGEHPFGLWFERETNIIANNSNIEHFRECAPDCHDLLSRMLAADPRLRPSARTVCAHPFLWSSSKQLHFLLQFSDRLERDEQVSQQLDCCAARVLGRWASASCGWLGALHTELQTDLEKHRSYSKHSVKDLLRVIRNKRIHFTELTLSLQQLLAPGPTHQPDELFAYFHSRFPQLFFQCVCVACGSLMHDSYFAGVLSAGVAHLLAAPVMAHVLTTDNSAKPTDSPVTAPPAAAAAVVMSEGRQAQWGGTAQDWCASVSARARPCLHLGKAAADPKYRSRLCSHWEMTGGAACPMRKKGKCDFAHGPLELRVRENRRLRWGHSSAAVAGHALRQSGGEDTLGDARASLQTTNNIQFSHNNNNNNSNSNSRSSNNPYHIKSPS